MRQTHFDFIVLGAGVSGLVLANELQLRGKQVLVLEKAERPGGVLQSVVENEMVWDKAAHTIAADNEILDFLAKYGFEAMVEKPSAAAKVRQLVIDGKIHNVESNPLKILTSGFLSVNAKARILTELFKNPISIENPTVEVFFNHHFGKEITDNIISAVFSGIYAGDIRKMEMKAVMGKVFEMEQEKGSVIRAMMANMKQAPKREIIGIKGGTENLMRGLALKIDHIAYNNEVLSYNIGTETTEVKTSEGNYTCHQLISTLPAYALAAIVEQNSRLGELLGTIEYASIALLHVAFKEEESEERKAFGFLNSQYADSNLKGAIYNSAIFPSRTSEGLESYSIFMKFDEEMDFETEIQGVIGEFRSLMSINGEIATLTYTQWQKGIPQFNKPYLARKKEIMDLADLEVSGSFISGVSVPDCIKYNVGLAEKLAKSY